MPSKKLSNHAADDLDDDFALDAITDSSPSSEDESPAPAVKTQHKSSAKRSLQPDSPSHSPAEGSVAPKKQKKAGKIQKFSVPADLSEQAELWNQYMQKAYPGITALELDDIKMLPKHMYPTENDAIESMEDLVKTVVSAGKAKNKIMLGAPQVLVICSSALRVIELLKVLRPLSSPKRPVLKLFSRHVKLEEHKKLLAKSPVDIAVGTPNRVLKLLSDKDLKVNRLKLVIIDCWQDDKMRVVVDMDDTRKDLFSIWRDELLPASANPDYGFRFRLV
ncbi:cms1 ribosomal small subunit [Coemansia sp. RSA 2703]|nr:cms1 ribosomal small subunit [Coemansia sp. RSA 2703]KAJ2379500.1 cms1 ribosomal small subunit [Coemansia sp. RSA 2607]KAJ2396348.1 cms1 ribosomal small subunit [Coemansia sp. RSA 2603]